MSTLIARCQKCAKIVSGMKTATLHLVLRDVRQYKIDHAEWESRCLAVSPVPGTLVIDGGQMAEEPPPVPWRVHCDPCNPHWDNEGGLCAGCYWISMDRVSTRAELLRWTAHLWEKGWFADTAWDQLIYRLLNAETP